MNTRCGTRDELLNEFLGAIRHINSAAFLYNDTHSPLKRTRLCTQADGGKPHMLYSPMVLSFPDKNTFSSDSLPESSHIFTAHSSKTIESRAHVGIIFFTQNNLKNHFLKVQHEIMGHSIGPLLPCHQTLATE